MTSKQKALNLFNNQNYNCAQSILRAYGTQYGITAAQAHKVAYSFGGSIAKNAGGICGAVNAGLMVIGLCFSKGDDISAQLVTMQKSREFLKLLKSNHPLLYCKDIVKEENKSGTAQENCQRIIEHVCHVLDQVLV